MTDSKNFGDQSRWNTHFGQDALAELKAAPQEWLIENRPVNYTVQSLLDSLPSLDGMNVLDFGSGQGWQSIAIARTGATVTGVDIGEDLVELARQVAELNKTECSFQLASVTDLPFEDDTFDVVIGNAILHHLTEDQLAESIREAFRVLKPGGKAYVNEPIENSSAFDAVQNLLPVGERGDSQYRPSILQRKEWKVFLEHQDHRALTDKELRQAGSQFADISIVYSGWLARLDRVVPVGAFKNFTSWADTYLSHGKSPVRRLSRMALVEYTK